jgi:hypothetical protein
MTKAVELEMCRDKQSTRYRLRTTATFFFKTSRERKKKSQAGSSVGPWRALAPSSDANRAGQVD